MNKCPAIIKPLAYLLFIAVILAGLYYTKVFLVPLSYGLLFAILLLPVSEKLEYWKIPRAWAIFFCIILVIVVIAGISTTLSFQVTAFIEDFPTFREKLSGQLKSIRESETGRKILQQVQLKDFDLQKAAGSAFDKIADIFSATADTLLDISLVFLYMVLFLFYRDKFKQFIFDVIPQRTNMKTADIIDEISRVVQKYIAGRFYIMLILALIYYIGFKIIQVDYALFFSVLAALLSLIPYLGNIIAFIPPFLMALILNGISGGVGVLVIFTFAQILENNVLMPQIAGKQVDINPFFSIVGVIAAGLLWGISGMILVIPFLGMLHIVFNHFDSTRPYARLIGEEKGEEGSWFSNIMERVKEVFRKE